MKIAFKLLPLVLSLGVSQMMVESFGSLSQRDALHDSKLEGFDPARDAAADLEAAISAGTKGNKRILIEVGGNWCPWCKRLNGLMKSNRDIVKVLADSYVVVRINFSSENPNKAVLAQYPRVAGYPHLFILNSKGKLICSQDTSELEDLQDYNAPKVRNFLKKWAP